MTFPTAALLVALAEMAMASEHRRQCSPTRRQVAAHAFWFGEDQARYVVTLPQSDAEKLVGEAKAAGVPAQLIGRTGGATLALPGEAALPAATLKDTFEAWLPRYMAGGA